MDADLLVIGGGLAGMAAALEARAAGASVLLADAGGGSSDRAQGGIAAAVGADDSPALHAADTVAAAAGLADPAAARVLAEEAPAAVQWLAAHGVEFDRGPDGRPALALEAAHSRPRILHAGQDASGAAIVAALRRSLPRRVELLEGARLAGLLLDGDGVAGARLRWQGETRTVRAPATLLATGGYAGLYGRTTTSPQCDGSALLAALLAGGVLADLELVQFHPTAFAGPGETFLVTEALRGAGAMLVDGGGRRFLLDADPRGELAPRAVVTRAIVEHLQRTGEASVLLDARGVGERLAREFPAYLGRCRQRGLDPLREPVPVAPAAHYTMGGVVTGPDGATAVSGLLAAGECAWTGVHGANRLASNSLVETVVFGRRAGRAALTARRRPAGDECIAAVAGGGGRLQLEDVRRVMDLRAGPLRRGRALERGLERLGQARGATPRAEAARQLACLVLGSALARTESRGAHVRADLPAEAPEWAELAVVVRAGEHGEPALEVASRAGSALRPARASASRTHGPGRPLS